MKKSGPKKRIDTEQQKALKLVECKTNLRKWTPVDIGPFEHSSGKHDVGRLEILKSDFKTFEDAVDERIERLHHEAADRNLE